MLEQQFNGLMSSKQAIETFSSKDLCSEGDQQVSLGFLNYQNNEISISRTYSRTISNESSSLQDIGWRLKTKYQPQDSKEFQQTTEEQFLSQIDRLHSELQSYFWQSKKRLMESLVSNRDVNYIDYQINELVQMADYVKHVVQLYTDQKRQPQVTQTHRGTQLCQQNSYINSQRKITLSKAVKQLTSFQKNKPCSRIQSRTSSKPKYNPKNKVTRHQSIYQMILGQQRGKLKKTFL